MLKRILAILSAAGIAVLIGGAPSWAGEGQDEHVPVNVCHATSSDTNPYVFITVDDDSTKFKGHLMHREDPNKRWKSDIIWNGVAYTAGDPKPDLIGSYTDTAGTFFEYDGEINSLEDCGAVTLPPEQEVRTEVKDRMDCDGVEKRTITITREYEWNGEEFVLGEPVKVVGDWEFVRDLTKAEKVELECVKDEPKPEPSPTPTPTPTEKPEPEPKQPELAATGAETWLAGVAALLIAAGSGLFWWTRRV